MLNNTLPVSCKEKSITLLKTIKRIAKEGIQVSRKDIFMRWPNYLKESSKFTNYEKPQRRGVTHTINL
jgi:hypothetical protein